MPMESKPHMTKFSRTKVVAILIAGIFGLAVTSLAANSYRWKDKDGKIHYGAAVPAEYADQPYDILNNAGIVIKHVEDTSVPLEVIKEKEVKKGRAPLISEEQRQMHSDRLLVSRYSSEEDIVKAQELEIAQLGYDMMIVEKSSKDTAAAIRSQISLAADQQRAGQQLNPAKQKEIGELYTRQKQYDLRRSSLAEREARVRTRFAAELERYRVLTSENKELDQEPADQG